MTLAHEHLDSIEVLDAVIADMRASGDTGHVENLLHAKDAVSQLRGALAQVMDLWDSDGMSIDGKAASLQNLPEKWRAALVAFGESQ